MLRLGLSLIVPLALIACENSVKIGVDTGLPDEETPDGVVDFDEDGVPADEDCDDADPDTRPGAEETFDGEDDDCDGHVDEVEVCENGFATIGEAMAAAPDDGLVLICAGTYPERLELSGRSLRLVGVDGADLTIVDGGGEPGAVVTVERDAELSIEGLTLRGGVAESGGGLRCDDAELSLSGVVITGNQAEADGGGLAATGCRLDLQSTTISGNSAGRYGGGLYADDSRGDLATSLIEANVALEGGGLFINGGDVDVTDNTIQGNEATTVDEEAWGPGGGGGGFWMATNAEVRGNVIASNHSAYQAGGGYFYRGRPTFSENQVLDNTCGEDGGGIYFNISTAQISGNHFEGNAASDDAGGLRLYYGSSVIEDNTLVGNTANDDGGGAKFSHSHHTFRRNHLEGNATGDAGGGLELDNDSTHVSDSVFINNSANRGAGLHNWRTEQRFTIETSHFEGNAAGDCGGGLGFDNSPYTVTLYDLEIVSNTADDGAGICTDLVYRDPEDVGGQEDYYQATLLSIRNVALVGNEADDDGGALYVRAGRVDARNLLVLENEGPDVSAAVVKEDGQLTLSNTILSDNTGGPMLGVEADGLIAVRYSDLHGRTPRTTTFDDPAGQDGNITDDPRLNADWTLSSASPCVDAGDPSLRDPDGSRSDMGLFGGPEAP